METQENTYNVLSVCQTIEKLSNKELKGLLKELSEISKELAPANCMQSKLLSSLFKKKDEGYYTYWSYRFNDIRTSTQHEILNRIIKDEWCEEK